MLPALILAASLAGTHTLVLYRGAELDGQPIRYWDVQDTVLDVTQPDRNFGGDYAMTSGTGKVILLRFGDLSRAIGRDQKVVSARIVLSYGSTDRPMFHSVGRVLTPWGEGPIITLAALRSAARSVDPTVKRQTPSAPRGAATWLQRRAGMATWQQAGAGGSADVAGIDGAKLNVLNDHELAIEGLGPTVDRMTEGWYQNQGFALTFDNACEFASSQAPEGRPRLEITVEPAPKADGPDLSVVRIERKPDRAAEGQEATFIAHVKNVGTAASQPFSARWSVQEREGSALDYGKGLEPGEETTFTTTATLPRTADHTLAPIGLRVYPKGPDAYASNDYAEAQVEAPTLDLFISHSLADRLKAGGWSPEDWAQDQVRLFDDTVLALSRFSFAPEGALERVNVGQVSVADQGAVSGGFYALLGTDRAEVKGPVALTPLIQACQAFFEKVLGEKPSAEPLTIELKQPGRPSVGPSPRYPGIAGWGDTQCDGPFASQLTMPYQAAFSPVYESVRPEATDLLNASLVELINESLAGGYRPSNLEELPRTVLLRAMDFNGQVLKDTEISLWQSANGVVADGPPTYTATTGAEGTLLLGAKPGSDGQTNPFGALKDLQTAFLVRATANGTSEWAWLPAWQLFDTASRGNKAAAVFDLHFNLPTAATDTVNLARNRIIADSAGRLPAQLAPLVDEDPQSEVTLDGKAGSWTEIDLGRDRPIAEVRLYFTSPEFWQRYDLVVYSTGQKAEDAFIWSREMDFKWSLENNSKDEGKGARSISYRGMAQRFRFLRIVNRQDGKPAKLSEIKAFAALPSTAP